MDRGRKSVMWLLQSSKQDVMVARTRVVSTEVVRNSEIWEIF